jgi:hypothetical protein
MPQLLNKIMLVSKTLTKIKKRYSQKVMISMTAMMRKLKHLKKNKKAIVDHKKASNSNSSLRSSMSSTLYPLLYIQIIMVHQLL